MVYSQSLNHMISLERKLLRDMRERYPCVCGAALVPVSSQPDPSFHGVGGAALSTNSFLGFVPGATTGRCELGFPISGDSSRGQAAYPACFSVLLGVLYCQGHHQITYGLWANAPPPWRSRLGAQRVSCLSAHNAHLHPRSSYAVKTSDSHSEQP